MTAAADVRATPARLAEARLAEARRDMYAFLAGMFLAPPTASAVGELASDECLDALAATLGAGAVTDLRELLRDGTVDADACRREFDVLFRVPLPGYVVPCESIHAGRGAAGAGNADGADEPGSSARLYGAPCRDVAALFAEAGAKLPEGVTEPPDHIGVELLFLSFLCDREAADAAAGRHDAAERWRGRHALFLRKHPAAWFGGLADGIRKRVPDGFYSALSQLVEAMLDAQVRPVAVPAAGGD